MKAEPYLETSDVARALGRSVSAVRLLLIARKLLPAARTLRGVRLFRKADVDRLVQQQQERRTARG